MIPAGSRTCESGGMRRGVEVGLGPGDWERLEAVIGSGNTHDLDGARVLLAIVPCPARLLADRAYDARSLRAWLAERGAEAVIPPNPTRKHPHAYDASAYKRRNLIERMFCRLKDFRRIATRYDKLARNFLAGLLLAAAVTWWPH